MNRATEILCTLRSLLEDEPEVLEHNYGINVLAPDEAPLDMLLAEWYRTGMRIPGAEPWQLELADRSVRLTDLGGRLPIPEWRCITWAFCVDCGCELFGPGDEDERLYDGEPLVCAECGCVHMMSVDEDGGEVMSNRNMNDQWVYLRPSALAGFRRLLGITPHHVEFPR